jgi:NAD(P)-dependent dehydrogenase (short-subunit alcohol dehydrogenase family)
LLSVTEALAQWPNGQPAGRLGLERLGEQAVVVGATGAIGSAVVRRLTWRGLGVVAVARNAARLAEIAAGGGQVTCCAADIGSNDSIEAIASCLTGPVRIAVFAAALPPPSTPHADGDGALSADSDLRLGGMLRLLHAVRDRLGPGSRLVTFADQLGEPAGAMHARHEAGSAAGAASGDGSAAGGLVGSYPRGSTADVLDLMRQLGVLYGPRGITTHTLCPGPADTPRLRSIAAAVATQRGVAADEVWQQYVAEATLGRLPTADEIAWAVEVLLDPEADLMHGSVLYLDAGSHNGNR